jgi:hypothetical protein
MKKFIQGRWTVAGIYCFSEETSSWEFESGYRAGEVVWDFGQHILTCLVDGQIDFRVLYKVSFGNRLSIDFSDLSPEFGSYGERYKMALQGDEVWLYDLQTRTRGGFWMAIKLIPFMN